MSRSSLGRGLAALIPDTLIEPGGLGPARTGANAFKCLVNSHFQIAQVIHLHLHYYKCSECNSK